MIELAALVFLLFVVLTVATLAGALLKLVFWAILLPFKFLLGVLLIPLLLVKAAVAGVALLVIAPLAALLLFGVALVTILALAVPLLPILCLGLLVWVVVRAAARPVMAA